MYNDFVQCRDAIQGYCRLLCRLVCTHICTVFTRFPGHRTFSDKLAVFSHPLTNGVARCADLRGPRVAGGNSVSYRRIGKFCAPGYSVGRARAEFAERIRKSNRIREHEGTRPNRVPMLILRQACTCMTDCCTSYLRY